MTTYFSNDLRPGFKIIFEEEPYSIESSEFVKPGKGQPFVRTKMRRLLTSTRIEKTFKSTDLIKAADVIDANFKYLYNDKQFYYFMHMENFEQFEIKPNIVSNAAKWLQNNSECIVTMWNDVPIIVQVPNFIDIKIIDTSVATKVDTITSSTKLAKLATGVIIKVPSFIQKGELVKVDTRSGTYVSRVK